MVDQIFGLIILPILIFVSKVIEVTIQTLRIIFTSRDQIKIAPIVGFFEVLIWLFAMGQIFSNITNIFYYFAYAAGFGMGNFVGIYVERKISIGLLNLQLILTKNPNMLLSSLKEAGYGLTILRAEGFKNILILLVIKRKNLKEILNIIEKDYPNAFISIQQVQSVRGGIFPPLIRRKSYRIRKRQKAK